MTTAVLSECPVCGSGGQITSLHESYDPTPAAQARLKRINGFREQVRKSVEAEVIADFIRDDLPSLLAGAMWGMDFADPDVTRLSAAISAKIAAIPTKGADR